MPESVSIQTGSRLHFGPLSWRPEHGRNFGGIGMMIERPGVSLTASRTNRSDDDVNSPRAAELLKRIRQKLSDDRCPTRECDPSPRESETLLREGDPSLREGEAPAEPHLSSISGHRAAISELTETRSRRQQTSGNAESAFSIRVQAEIPSHLGLGSGTQLGLALAESVCLLSGEERSAFELAELAGRGERSGVGICGYELGGFLVDAGHRTDDAPAELSVRMAFPDDWPVLLLIPPRETGCHGAEEQQIFHAMERMSPSLTGELCRLVLTEILPAIRQRQFDEFTAGLEEYGRRIGTYFSPLQGGEFSSSRLRSLAAALRRSGERGPVQSSWGPSAVLFAENSDHAEELTARVLRFEATADCRIIRTTVRNSGRRCDIVPVD